MGTIIQLDDLNDIIARIREKGEKDAELWARNAREQAEQSVKDAEQTRLAILLLGSVGIEPTHIYDTSVRIVLGFFPSTAKGNRALATTIRRWQPWLVEQGVSVAFVGQDGAEDLDLPWHTFRAWFIGGSTAWKLSRCSAELTADARKRGKLVHMGRVNSRRRLWAAYTMGCDSVDGGSLSRWGDRHLARFCRWLRLMKRVQLLWR
jgi:hypothetical protein